MSARHVVLGLLLQGPAYPYQLADRLQQRVGSAWAINSGQLYRTIKRIEQEGLIEAVDHVVERPDRHIFAVTDAGVEEFERWWEETTSAAGLSRRSFLAKITLAGPERLKYAPKQIEAYERDRTARLTELSHAREKTIDEEGPRMRADQVLLRLNLTAEIIQLEGELELARHAGEMVSRLLNREATWPSRQERDEALDKRQGAREELFGRIAASHLRSISSEPEPGSES